MIKIRNKRIALLLVLTMLATMFIGVGTSTAGYSDNDDYIVVTSTWEPILADATSVAGTITVADEEDWEATNIDIIWAEITLPDDGEVKFANTPNFTDPKSINGLNDWQVESKNDYSIVIYTENTDEVDVYPDLYVDNIKLKATDDAEGSINAAVHVWAVDTDNDILNEETDSTVKIAYIDSGDINVKVASKVKTVRVGDEEVGSKLTFTEAGYSSFDVGDDIKVTIKKSGVKWDDSMLDTSYKSYDYDSYDFDQFVETGCDVDDVDINSNGKVLTFNVRDLDSLVKSNVVLTPLLIVEPGTTGDITVEVSDSDHNIDTEVFTIAKVGGDGVDVSVKNDDKDFVYRGQIADFDEVEVKLDPAHAMDAEDWFSVTLPEGCKWIVNDGDTFPFALFDYYGDPIKDNQQFLDYDGLLNDDRTVWFTVLEDDEDWLMVDIYSNIKLTDFVIGADANAVVGDLNVTFDGCVEGTYKIGSVKNAFTVATTPFYAQANVNTSIAGPNIVITETDDGALCPTFEKWSEFMGWIDLYWDNEYVDWYIISKDWDPTYFDIALPAGMTFDGVPEVDVTDGDIDLGDVTILDNATLRIEIDEASTELSTITISGLDYNVFNQPALGDMTAKVGADYNMLSDKVLETLNIGNIATNPTAIYVIGATTFTVNGVVNNCIAPSYVSPVNNRTYLAIRDITTGLGIDPTNVLWDEANQRVTMIKGDKIVQVTIGSTTMYVNGVAIAMDAAPEMGPTFRSMLPAAFIAQAFGAVAYWDGTTNTVTIK